MSPFSIFRTMDRRKLFIWGGVGLISFIIIIVIIVVSTRGTNKVTKGSDALTSTPVIDGHNDLANNLREILNNTINDFKFDSDLKNDSVWGSKSCKFCYTDLPRLKQGNVGAQFWAVYVNCTSQYRDAVAQTLEQIDVIKRLIKKYPNDLKFAKSVADIVDAFDEKKIASLLGVEGGHSIDARLGVLRMFYDLGVRYMTLTHTCNTPWADASTSQDKPVHSLTDFGKEVIHEMNRLGMMVDLSHVSANVMRLAIKESAAPVIFSHSCAYALHKHDRNVPDDVLKMLKEKDGVVMINFYSDFLGPNPTISTVIDHINYIADLIGPEHVGLGADYDGVDKVPKGLEDVSKYPVLFDMLHQNNSEKWSLQNLEKLAGRNLLRVFKKVEDVKYKLITNSTYEKWISEKDLNESIPKDLQICRDYNNKLETDSNKIDDTNSNTPNHI